MMLKLASLFKRTTFNENKTPKNHGKPKWILPLDALQRGYISYLVKFLGRASIDQSKGIDGIEEGILKMKLSQHARRADGAKNPKVKLTISMDRITVQGAKSKTIYNRIYLRQISYCAGDTSDPKFFSFIAKDAESDRHNLYIFKSYKSSKEITLTINQACELSNQRFLETSERGLKMREQIMALHEKVQELEAENRNLKNLPTNSESESRSSLKSSGFSVTTNGADINKLRSIHPPPPPPPPPMKKMTNRNHHREPAISLLDIDDQPTVGRKLENLSLDDQTFDPMSLDESKVNDTMYGNILDDQQHYTDFIDIVGNNHNQETYETNDLFGFKPFYSRIGMRNQTSIN